MSRPDLQISSVDMDRILKVAETNVEEALDILCQEKKAGLKELYLGVNKVRDKKDSKLYHRLLKAIIKIK